MKTKKFTLMATVLIFSAIAYSQIPNAGFENWTNDGMGNLNPTGWQTSNDSASGLTGVVQETPAYQGTYAVKVKVVNAGFFNMFGYCLAEFSFSPSKPTSLDGFLKTTVMPSDSVSFFLGLYNGDSSVAGGYLTYTATVGSYTAFSVPFNYVSALTPDSAGFFIKAGNFFGAQLGTELIMDDLSFGFGTGINKQIVPLSSILGQNYPNPSSEYTVIPLQLSSGSEVSIKVFDVLGKEIKSVDYGTMSAGKHLIRIPVADLPNGVYYYSLKGSDFAKSSKFVVNK